MKAGHFCFSRIKFELLKRWVHSWVLLQKALCPYIGLPKQHHNKSITLTLLWDFSCHIQKALAKIIFRVNIGQDLTGTCWRANSQVLHTSDLFLIFSAAEYFALVWLNSDHSYNSLAYGYSWQQYWINV